MTHDSLFLFSLIKILSPYMLLSDECIFLFILDQKSWVSSNPLSHRWIGCTVWLLLIQFFFFAHDGNWVRVLTLNKLFHQVWTQWCFTHVTLTFIYIYIQAVVSELWYVEEYDVLALALNGRMNTRKFRLRCSKEWSCLARVLHVY